MATRSFASMWWCVYGASQLAGEFDRHHGGLRLLQGGARDVPSTRGEGAGRLSAKRFGVTYPLRQSPDRYATRRGANACRPFMKGLKRLRKAAFWPTAHVSSKSLESYWPGSSSSSCAAPSL